MKNFVSLILVLAVSAGGMSAWGYESVSVDNLYYYLNEIESAAYVTANPNKYAGHIVIPSSITYDKKTYPVTRIWEEAFANCTELTEVDVPESVTYIERRAFRNCSKLTSFAIPSGVTSINYGTFENCTNLNTVSLPDGLTYIDRAAFIACTNLSTINTPESVTYIGQEAFYKCTSLPVIDGIRYADKYLVSVVDTQNPTYTIKEGTLWIAENAFQNCSQLTSIVIPNSVQIIGAGAFSGRDKLTTVTIGSGVWRIQESAFFSCTSISSLEVPNTVTSIGESAFYNLPNVIYNGTASGSPWGARSLNGYNEDVLVFADESKTKLLACLTSAEGKIVVPESVTHIAEKAFYNCKKIEEVVLGDNVVEIGSNAFRECSMKQITLGEALTAIDNYAFQYCTQLQSIVIPDNVTTIDYGAFYYCPNLTDITFGKKLVNIGADAFYDCSMLTNIHYNGTLIDWLSVERTGLMNYWKGGNLYIQDQILTDANIPSEVENIPANAFNGCTCLTAISLPEGVMNVGDYAFGRCSELVSIIMPEGVVEIGDFAFTDCSKLEHVSLPNTLMTLGRCCFNSCTTLQYLSIPENLFTIGEGAFDFSGITSIEWNAIDLQCVKDYQYTCSDIARFPLYALSEQLTSITFGEKVSVIPTQMCMDLKQIESIVLPESVTKIGDFAFSFASGLKSINIPKNVEEIGKYAFDGCESLTNIDVDEQNTMYTDIDGVLFSKDTTQLLCFPPGIEGTYIIPSSVKDIPEAAFSRSKLSVVTIPESVEHIAGYSFSFGNLAEVHFLAQTPPEIDYYAFAEMSCLFRVPCGSGDLYYEQLNEKFSTYGYQLQEHLVEDCIYRPIIDFHYDITQQDCQYLVQFYNDSYLAIYDSIEHTLHPSSKQAFVYWDFGDWTPVYEQEPQRYFSLYGETFEFTMSLDYSLGYEYFRIDTTFVIEIPQFKIDTTEFVELIKPGETYTWEGEEFQEQGDYTKVLSNQCGLDSVVVLHLSVYDDATPTELPSEQVVIQSGETQVTISWPAINNAESYEITITKDGEKVCTLIFNAQGQLIGIAFAPSRYNTNKQQIEGFKFTITGLYSGTNYDYFVVAKDESDQIIDTKSGSFITTNTTTNIDRLENNLNTCDKFVINGTLYILRDGVMYNAQGARVE